MKHIAMSVALIACATSLAGCAMKNELSVILSIGATLLSLFALKLNPETL